MQHSSTVHGLDNALIASLIQVVRDAARQEIMPRFRHLSTAQIKTKSGPDDLVTVADQASERFITERVVEILSGASVVGEEAAAEDPDVLSQINRSEWCVIIDPIDGTSNYAHGIAVFGVILAVTYKGECVFGLLYDPVLDDWVLATKSDGAWFCRPGYDDVQLNPLAQPQISEAHGYVPLWLFDEAKQLHVITCYPQFQRVSCLRCSCHEYRQMALGHAQFVVSPTPKPWDHAAGVLVLRELGGAGSIGQNDDYQPGVSNARALVAGSKSVQREVRQIIFGA
jgi:fructose-1,6-bisphosphatase/inositol monophosphatase family enzyme